VAAATKDDEEVRGFFWVAAAVADGFIAGGVEGGGEAPVEEVGCECYQREEGGGEEGGHCGGLVWLVLPCRLGGSGLEVVYSR